MSDDLVSRLREDQPVTQDMESTLQCALQDEAADRIEELEAKLAKAVDLLNSWRLASAGYISLTDVLAKHDAALEKLKGQTDE